MKIVKYILSFLLFAVMGCNVYAAADRQYIRQGNQLYRQGNFVKAEVAYRKALAANSSNSQAVYNLGCALLMQNKDKEAARQFEKSSKMEKSPVRRAMSYHNMGVIAQKHQLYPDAINAYEEALRNNPDDNQTRYNLALCKRLNKNNKQNNNKNQNKNQNKKNKQNKQNKNNKNQNNKNNKNNQNQNNKQPKPKDQLSKDNAEQLLNVANQEEQATQQRIKQKMQKQGGKPLQQNW